MLSGKTKTLIILLAAFAAAAGDLWAVEYKGSSFRDPFEIGKAVEVKAAPQAPVMQQALFLRGILIFRETKPKALINDKVVQAGDKIGDVTILEITKDGVKVKDSTHEWLLKR